MLAESPEAGASSGSDCTSRMVHLSASTSNRALAIGVTPTVLSPAYLQMYILKKKALKHQNIEAHFVTMCACCYGEVWLPSSNPILQQGLEALAAHRAFHTSLHSSLLSLLLSLLSLCPSLPPSIHPSISPSISQSLALAIWPGHSQDRGGREGDCTQPGTELTPVDSPGFSSWCPYPSLRILTTMRAGMASFKIGKAFSFYLLGSS